MEPTYLYKLNGYAESVHFEKIGVNRMVERDVSQKKK